MQTVEEYLTEKVAEYHTTADTDKPEDVMTLIRNDMRFLSLSDDVLIGRISGWQNSIIN